MWIEIVLLFVSPPPQRCTNTQMAADDNLIGFSSVTLPTTCFIISIKLNTGCLFLTIMNNPKTHPCLSE